MAARNASQSSKLHEVRDHHRSSKPATNDEAGNRLAATEADAARTTDAPAEVQEMTQADDAEYSRKAVPSLYETLDHVVPASIAKFTRGLSPAALMEAWFDWYIHIAAAPGKRLHLAEKAAGHLDF